MPYRRLPNTDQARLRSLRKAIQAAGDADFGKQALQYRTLNEAQRMLMQFENQVAQYQANVDSKVSANKKYRHEVHNARMYISHFIQVLNMCIARGEMKKEIRELYHLNPNSKEVPNLSSEEALLEWGAWIIEGEQKRTQMGGFPIYNPAINKVKVHYDIFKEHYTTHQMRKATHNRVYEDVESLRVKADALILEIWNQVEAFYAQELPYAKLKKCQAYGVIYYYRPKEKRLTEASDNLLKNLQQRELTLQWSETEQ